MKRISCEMCGSSDFIKTDGLYQCNHCGTKYSVEEARKLLVEGTVKIDNSQKLINLYTVARQARDSDDAESAAKYYDMIMQEDPGSWEATFYNVYFRAMQTIVMYIASAANSVRNCLDTVFSLINYNVDDITTQKAVVTEVFQRVSTIGAILESNARSTFMSSADNLLGTYDEAADAFIEYVQEYYSRSQAVNEMFFVLGDLIERDFSSDSNMQKLAVTSWKEGIQYWVNDYKVVDTHKDDRIRMEQEYGAKIRKYEVSYRFPEPNYIGFPLDFIKLMNKQSSRSTSSGGGCYVATVVYGSYDCPQVWTLRRFRDYKLSEKWYGRIFIRAYYVISPTLVKWFGNTEWFKMIWKGRLDRMVENLKAEGIEDTPYLDKKW